MGLLAELICVEDSDEARIIAAYSRSAMETLVVQDRATQVDMARHHEFKHVRCISLETCRQFRGPTNMIKGSPRLEVLQRRHDYAWVNEMHAVNIIDFHYPDHEYLRAKVVFGLLPKFLVVPFSFEEMGERRRVAQAQHVDLPDMIDKREGRCVLYSHAHS